MLRRARNGASASRCGTMVSSESSVAEAVITAPRASTVSRIPALSALGLVFVRRGDRAAQRHLDEALALARRIAEPQRLVPVLLARAELAWFTGRHDDVTEATGEGLTVLGREKRAFDRDRLWYWLWKVGALRVQDVEGDGPFVRLMRGDWMAAAAYWKDVGCPYEYAQALIEGDLAAVQEALHIYQTLSAGPAIDWARQRLRQMGLTRVPRGRRASTRAHPAGLTAREAEILAMLALAPRTDIECPGAICVDLCPGKPPILPPEPTSTHRRLFSPAWRRVIFRLHIYPFSGSVAGLQEDVYVAR